MNPIISCALEQAAIICLEHGLHDWPPEAPATKRWLSIVAGLKAIGAVGYVKRTNGWAILYELLPDDPEYIGMCGDGQGDRFAVTQATILHISLLP